jgi:4-hydroxy-2-oxoglutarate aldolase
MKAADLHGIFPPITTPFVAGKLSCEKLAANIERWNKTGLSGYVAFGSNGEYNFLSEPEKLEVVKAVVGSAAPGMKVIAGTGCESTWETIHLTNACAKLGAHAALVVTPHYYGGRMNEAALLQHFTAVADGADIPVMIYNVTKFTHIQVSLGLVAKLSRHPNVIGIKDSNGNVSFLGEMLDAVDKDFSVLVGTAGALFGALALGCAGGVLALANLAPEACVRILDLLRQGDVAQASRLQKRMLPLNTAVTATYGVPGLKAALDMLGYFGGDPRPPLLPATDKEKTEIREILKKAELL